MAQYGDFSIGKIANFDKIFSENDRTYIQRFIDNAAMLKVNYRFCFENFSPENKLREVDNSGVLSFNIDVKKTTPDGMADFKAPLAHSTGIDFEGRSGYTGSAATFGKALNPIDWIERRDMLKLQEQFGNDDKIVQDYIQNLQTLRNYLDSRLSNMAGQLLSTGCIIGQNQEKGTLMYRQDAKVPTENRVNAGSKAWTDPTCDLLDEMHKIEMAYRDRTGDEQPLKWQIPLKMWRETFLTNTKIREKVKEWRTIRELPISSGGTILEEWYTEYVNTLGLTSPIEIVKEGEVVVGLDTRKDVQGWDSKIAILRPTGNAGVIVHGEALKAIMARENPSQSIRRNVAFLESGLYALVASVRDIDGFPVQTTEMESCSAPALTCAPYLTIVDTSQAD